MLGGITSAFVYYSASTALASEPPAENLAGWIGVLKQSTTIKTNTQVRISAFSEADDHRSLMAYSVTACGGDAFSGYFLAGGDARLNNSSIESSFGAARQLPGGDITVTGLLDETIVTYPNIQVIQILIENPPPCIGEIDDENYIGVGFQVKGTPLKPVAISGKKLLFKSAVERWTMPYVGGFPEADSQLGVFQISGALSGNFIRPAALAAIVDAGPIPVGQTLSDARPSTRGVDRASWYQPKPFQATAKISNLSRQTLLQRRVAFSTIGLGVFSSLGASVIFEWTRFRTKTELVRPSHLPAPGKIAEKSGRQTVLNLKWLAVVITGYIVGWLGGRMRK